MSPEIIETRGHTSRDGVLELSLKTAVADVDVVATVHVRQESLASETDAYGWPKHYFEEVAGSMPDLRRWPEGGFEERQALDE